MKNTAAALCGAVAAACVAVPAGADPVEDFYKGKTITVVASTGAGGRLVSGLAYDSDYLTARGEINELRAAAAAKHCDSVPGAASPAARASDSAIR